jgi:hypothetical protein
MIALLFVLGCQPAQMLDPLEQPEVAVEVHIAEKQVGAAEEVQVEVRLSAREDWLPDAFEMAVKGLEVEALEAEVMETEAGERETHRFLLSGPDGSYVLEPMAFSFSKADGQSMTRESARLFFDIGPQGLRSELEGLVELPAAKENPWPKRLFWSGVAVLLLMVALFFWWRRPREPAPALPVISPEEEALAAWAAAWNSAHLDDHGRALALSQIYRRYLERVFLLPASAFTSFEVLDALRDSLSERHFGQSKRLLGATDRIKYARRGGGRALFESLDADFRELIEAIRPKPVQEAADA